MPGKIHYSERLFKHSYSDITALYERYQIALQASEVYRSWLPDGVERLRSETIRGLLAAQECQAAFDHRADAQEAAAALRKLTEILHDDEQLLSDYKDQLLPRQYFPHQSTGCGKPLCGHVECPANRRQWRRLKSAITFYQAHERAYPTYNGLLVANPRKEISRHNVNDLTRGKLYTVRGAGFI